MVTQHKKGTLCGLYLEITAVVSHMSERKIWINFDANQIFLPHVNYSEKSFDLRLFFRIFGRAAF